MLGTIIPSSGILVGLLTKHAIAFPSGTTRDRCCCNCTLGDFGSSVIGRGASGIGRTALCTLGSIARVGGNIPMATMGAYSTGSGMVHLNISASLARAHIWSVPRERKGDAGAGLLSASTRILATFVALSMANIAGISISCEKNRQCELYTLLVILLCTLCDTGSVPVTHPGTICPHRVETMLFVSWSVHRRLLLFQGAPMG